MLNRETTQYEQRLPTEDGRKGTSIGCDSEEAGPLLLICKATHQLRLHFHALEAGPILDEGVAVGDKKEKLLTVEPRHIVDQDRPLGLTSIEILPARDYLDARRADGRDQTITMGAIHMWMPQMSRASNLGGTSADRQSKRRG
jgi:hypothetical protein